MGHDTYLIERHGQMLILNFGRPTVDGGEIVRDADARLREMDDAGELAGGGLIGLDGKVSVAVAMTLGHVLAHRFSSVAMRDPKIQGSPARYIVTISHDPRYPVGMILTRDDFEILDDDSGNALAGA